MKSGNKTIKRSKSFVKKAGDQHAQGMEQMLDMTYVPEPGNPKIVKAWRRKQQFVYTMLTERVKIHTSKRILQRHDDYMDGRQALYDLAMQARQSTEAVLAGRRTREKIAQSRYDPRSGSALVFITKFEELMESYNMQQHSVGMILSGPMMKSYLQTAVASVMMLRAVSDRENDRTIKGGDEYTYDEYLEAIKNAATIYDEHSSGRRTAHLTQVAEGPDITNEIADYIINVAKRRAPGASMNKETWQSISEEGKAVWDKLSNGDKQKILQYAMKRAAAKEPVLVNQVTSQNPEDVNEEHPPEEPAEGDPEMSEPADVEINKIISKARQEAHPGDVRRVLSGTPKKKQTTQVKFAQWTDDTEWYDTSEGEGDLDELLEDYDWNPDDDQDFH